MIVSPFQRMFFCVLFAVSLTIFAVDAYAQELKPSHVDPITELRFPPKLSKIKYVRVVEYDDVKDGYCVLYTATNSYGQICVYDFGHRNLPTGVESKEFSDALQIAIDNTIKAFSTSPYRNGKLFATATPAIEGDGKIAKAELRMFTSILDLPNDPSVNNMHLVLMTTALGKFIKFNYTAKNPKSDEFAEETKKIIEEFIQFNGSTMPKFLVPVKS